MKRIIAQLLSGGLLLTLTSIQLASAESRGDVVFDISKFEVSGNTILTASTIDNTLAPFVGKNRDFDTIERAMDALEKAFHARGYKLISIALKEQELNHGVVHLTVVPTRIAQVVVTGNTTFNEHNIRRSLPALRTGETPDMDALSSSLKFANEHPAKKITMKLKSGDNPNEVDAMLDVAEDNPWKLTVSLDNAGQKQTGETNVSVALAHSNLWGLDHLASVQYATTAEKPKQISVYGGSYHIPFYDSRNSLDFYGNYSDVDSGTVVSGLLNFGITGKGTIFGTRYNMRLSDNKDSEAKLVLGLDVKKFKSAVLVSGFDLGGEIVVRPLSINYLNQWTAINGLMSFSLTASQNIGGANNGKQEDFSKARIGAKANFGVLRYALSYSRAFDSDMQIRAVINGQYASGALIPGEQFGAGGASSVRGFSERVISNDIGTLLNAELYSPNFCKENIAWTCRMLGFYDAAHAKRNKALPGEVESEVISSIGVGWRFSFGSNAAFQIDYGHVLKENKFASKEKNRLHARVNFSY
jgi:hemolysin activation/secretion protein